PAAHLLMVLKVAGAAASASAGGKTSGASGSLKLVRTGCPVSSATREMSKNRAPSGVVITQVSQSPARAEISAGSSRAGGAPDAITYSTGRRSTCTSSGPPHESPYGQPECAVRSGGRFAAGHHRPDCAGAARPLARVAVRWRSLLGEVLLGLLVVAGRRVRVRRGDETDHSGCEWLGREPAERPPRALGRGHRPGRAAAPSLPPRGERTGAARRASQRRGVAAPRRRTR